MSVTAIYGEVFCHESEDLEKVKSALGAIFPKEKIKVSTLSGMFGTKIKILKVKIEKKKEAEKIIEELFSNLSDLEKRKLLNELNLRMDDQGRLFIRLNKDDAFEGRFSLDDEQNSIQLIIFLKTFPANRKDYIKTARELIESFINNY